MASQSGFLFEICAEGGALAGLAGGLLQGNKEVQSLANEKGLKSIAPVCWTRYVRTPKEDA